MDDIDMPHLNRIKMGNKMCDLDGGMPAITIRVKLVSQWQGWMQQLIGNASLKKGVAK